MPRPEIFVPYPETMKTAPVTTGVRSTTLIVSREALKERGHFAAYSRHLPREAQARLEQAVAGVWLPLELGEAHYLACDALSLSLTEERELGGQTLSRLRDTLLGTMAKTLGASGIVSLWDVLQRYHVFFERSFSGGGSRVWKVGPKEALLEISGLPLARIPYLRHAYGGLLSEGARFFYPSSRVAEVARLCSDTTLGFRVSWV
jgi:hypothetical protein